MQTSVNVLLAGLVLAFFVVPLVRGALQAVSEHDAWAPFATRADGRGALLAPGRYFSALRAPRAGGRTTTGLAARWIGWVAITLALVAGVVQSVVTSANGGA